MKYITKMHVNKYCMLGKIWDQTCPLGDPLDEFINIPYTTVLQDTRNVILYFYTLNPSLK